MPYRLTVEVETQEKAAVIVQCLNKGEGRLISLTEVAPDPNSIPKKKRMRFANGMRNKGISSVDLVLELLKAGPKTTRQLEQGFVERGFAGSSTSGAISATHRDGKIKPDLVEGTWTLK